MNKNIKNPNELTMEIGDKTITPEFQEIVKYPDERLNTVCLPVNDDEFGTDDIYQTVANMYSSMIKFGGVGIAANQIGVMKRIAIVKTNEHTFIMVNPRIFLQEGQLKFEEGCLSFPGIFQTITRFEKIRIVYQDVDGVHQELTVSGDVAVAIQHELDYLDGKTMLNRLNSLKRLRLKKKLKKQDWYNVS